MAKKARSFDEWFVAQHGRRPSGLPLDELMRVRNSKKAEAYNAESVVDACNMWEEKRTSALYAWQAALANNIKRKT